MNSESADKIAESQSADVILYAGGIWYESGVALLNVLRGMTQRRPNIFLVLATYGGLPDQAYRMARFLRGAYEGKIIALRQKHSLRTSENQLLRSSH